MANSKPQMWEPDAGKSSSKDAASIIWTELNEEIYSSSGARSVEGFYVSKPLFFMCSIARFGRLLRFAFIQVRINTNRDIKCAGAIHLYMFFFIISSMV